jgi:hypothetical protein
VKGRSETMESDNNNNFGQKKIKEILDDELAGLDEEFEKYAPHLDDLELEEEGQIDLLEDEEEMEDEDLESTNTVG